MGFPSTIRDNLISGVIGEISHDGPMRSVPAILGSEDPENNVIGRAFTWVDGPGDTVQAGGDGAFAGIFILPKNQPLYGVPGDPLADSLTLPNGTAGEFMEMGFVFVALATEGAPRGALVVFDEATGELDWIASPADPGDGRALVPNCTVDRHVGSDGVLSLAIIKLTN